jgi:GntR family transcriptional regulator
MSVHKLENADRRSAPIQPSRWASGRSTGRSRRSSSGGWSTASGRRASLPSEGQLAAEIGVSQGTVRKALDELAAENLLVRRQGRGTFVAEHDERRILFQFFKLVHDDGERRFPDSKVLGVETGTADEDERKALDLEAGASVIRIRRLRAFETRPIILERSACRSGSFRGSRQPDPQQPLQPVRGALWRDDRPCARAAEGVALSAGRGWLLGAPAGTPCFAHRPRRALARRLAGRIARQPLPDRGGSLPVRPALSAQDAFHRPFSHSSRRRAVHHNRRIRMPGTITRRIAVAALMALGLAPAASAQGFPQADHPDRAVRRRRPERRDRAPARRPYGPHARPAVVVENIAGRAARPAPSASSRRTRTATPC